MRKARRIVTAVFVIAAAFIAAGGTGWAQDFSKYHNYGELTTIVQSLAGANKTLVKLESIGKTLEKRDLWMLQIANPAGVPVAERPGVLIAANFEGDHVYGSELALFIADFLVKSYGSNANVKQRLDNFVYYVVPRVNPDGAEFMWAPLKWARRTNTHPFDDDNDGRLDEDGPEDLNKDGVITVMRVKDPNGDYIVDPEDARLMRKADPKKGEKGEYALYWEGIDNDGDGFINEDGPGGVNINRNFMHEYPFYKADAGRYMVSEAETRAMLEFMIAHRNIGAILTFGESDNLVTPPTAAGTLAAAKGMDLETVAAASIAGANKTGMFAAAAGFGGGRGGFGGGRGGGGEMMISEEMLQEIMAAGGGAFMMGGAPGGGGGQRGGGAAAAAAQPAGRGAMPQRAAATTYNSSDVDYFRTISAKYAELTGIRQTLMNTKPEGAFFSYGYFQFGVPSFSTPGWGTAEAQRGGGMAGPGMGAGAPGAGGQGQMAQMQQQFAAAAGQRAGTAGAAGFGQRAGAAGAAGAADVQGVDRQLLQWMDKEKIDGFVAWTKVKHPDFGEVEVGGFKPYVFVNPPAAKIAEMGKAHAEFALYLPTIFPSVKIAKFEAVAQGGGLYRVKAEIENTGFLPTALTQGVTARSVKPTMVQLQVAPESIVSGNQKTNFIQALIGSGGRMKFDWLIKGKAGSSLELKVVSQKAGADKRAVVLK
jgi:hypothetical protein